MTRILLLYSDTSMAATLKELFQESAHDLTVLTVGTAQIALGLLAQGERPFIVVVDCYETASQGERFLNGLMHDTHLLQRHRFFLINGGTPFSPDIAAFVTNTGLPVLHLPKDVMQLADLAAQAATALATLE